MTLKQTTSPRVMVEAAILIGVKEFVGKDHNPVIMNWAKELNLEKTYTSDEIPWCGLAVAYVVMKAGYDPIENPLWARNWAKWGTKADTPMFGDVLVFSRKSGGHVGFYRAEDDKYYYVLGGNQNNEFNVMKIDKSRLIAARRSPWKIKQPSSVKKMFMKGGKVSTNEA